MQAECDKMHVSLFGNGLSTISYLEINETVHTYVNLIARLSQQNRANEHDYQISCGVIVLINECVHR